MTDDRTRGPKKRPSSSQGDDGPTSIDGPNIRQHGDSQRHANESTNVDGPRVEALADPHDTVSAELMTFESRDDDDEGDGDGDGEDPTIYRGDQPPKPSSSRRLSPTLMRIFQRKREQIGLSIAQVAKLTGIDEAELMRFEGTNGQHRLVYDHAVLVARVLGIRPQDMPGLRSGKDPKDPVGAALGSLMTSLVAGPTLTFEGKSGERFGGDLERIGTTPHFAIKLGDGSLGEAWPKSTLLAFMMDASPQPGDVVLVRNRRNKQLGLRRASGQAFMPLAPWQPSYPTGGDWLPVARLQAILPRT